jgi:hypothetical protein
LFIANPNQRWTATSPTKNIYFVDGLEKFCRKKVTCDTRKSTSNVEKRSTSFPLILGRSFHKIVRAIDVGKTEIKFKARGVHSSQLRFEVCVMINVNYVLPHRHIGREEPKENEAKEEKMLHPSRPRINVRLWRPKRWLSWRINLHWSQGWCRSRAPNLATPAKSVDPERREEV